MIGLGNPGSDYENTHHNAGRIFLSRLALKNRSKFNKIKGKHFEYAEIPEWILIFPTTFMNESGEAANEALRYFKIEDHEKIFVAHDDSDLSIGSYKITMGGGSAGHHGIDSVIANIKSSDFWRIRIGIRPEAPGPRKKAGDFVLSPLSKKHQQILQGVSDEIILKLIEKKEP